MDSKLSLRLPSHFRKLLDDDAASAGVTTSRMTLEIIAQFYGIEVPERQPTGFCNPELAAEAQAKSVESRLLNASKRKKKRKPVKK